MRSITKTYWTIRTLMGLLRRKPRPGYNVGREGGEYQPVFWESSENVFINDDNDIKIVYRKTDDGESSVGC